MKLCLRLCSLVAILLGSTPTTSFAADQQAPATLHKVTVGLIYIAADAGIFFPKEKGYFPEQGIEVDLNRFTSGGDQIPLLASDKLDVGSGGSTPGLFNAYLRGFDVPI